MPFTTEQFLNVFEQYNAAIFPLQLIFNGLALAAIVLCILPGRINARAVSAILALLWFWMGIGYHLLFFTAINRAAYIFATAFLIQSGLFLWWGVLNNKFRFRAASGLSGILGWAMAAYALVIYPLLGYAFGHVYPRSPTFGAPCPTTIFTFALLIWQRGPMPAFVLAIPILWSLIGFAAALTLGIAEDTGLLIAGVSVACIYAIRVIRGPGPELAD